MEGLFYDWFGLNAWLGKGLHSASASFINGILTIGYSYYVVALVLILVCYHYMRIRHYADNQQLDNLGEFVTSVIIAFSVVWCIIVTFHNIDVVSWSGTFLPELAGAEEPVFRAGSLPASAPALSSMLAYLLWQQVSRKAQKYLLAYVISACVLAIAAGPHWPTAIVVGVLTGVAGARFARWYCQAARRLVRPADAR